MALGKQAGRSWGVMSLIAIDGLAIAGGPCDLPPLALALARLNS